MIEYHINLQVTLFAGRLEVPNYSINLFPLQNLGALVSIILINKVDVDKILSFSFSTTSTLATGAVPHTSSFLQDAYTLRSDEILHISLERNF